MPRPSTLLVPASLLALAGLATLAAIPGAAAADATVNATVDVHPDRAPETRDPEGLLTLENWTRNATLRWSLATDANYTVVDVRVHEGFDVTRGRQIVPLVGGNHFVELDDFDGPLAVDRPATVFNLTEGTGPNGSDDGNVSWTYRLGIPGPTETNLTLHRDVTPPEHEVDRPRNVSHVGFDLRTETSEVALATLVIEPPEDVDEIVRRFPTPRPAPVQQFPAQGLSANTTYSWHVEFADWSGNTVRTGERPVTTAPAPDPPEPEVTPVSPVPGTTVESVDVVVEARWESPESPVLAGGIRLFVDKVPIPKGDVVVDEDRVRYLVPDPLPTRNVSVAAEVPNEAGGTGVARWSFAVQDASTPADRESPLAPALALSGLAIAGLLAGRAREG